MVDEGLKHLSLFTMSIGNTAYTITGIAIGIYSAKNGLQLTGRFVERQLNKPSLVR